MCQFSNPFSGTSDDFFNRIKEKIEDAHGTISENAASGNFRVPVPLGHIDGNYTINNGTIDITITHLPRLISCDQIRQFVQEELVN